MIMPVINCALFTVAGVAAFLIFIVLHDIVTRCTRASRYNNPALDLKQTTHPTSEVDQ